MTISPRTLILIPLAAASLLLLAACGNKGPLVLPQKPVPVEETVEPAADAETTPAATQDVNDGSPSVTPDPVKKVDDGNE